MHSLNYRITTTSSTVISTISGDMNMVATMKYIPGSSVLGLLAKQYIDQCGSGRLAHKDEEFYRWFLAGELKIGNAYILSEDEYGEHSHFPTPLSIQKQKYATNTYDLLFYDQQKNDRTERIGDFCYFEDNSLYIKGVETTINFHHKRNRATGTSEEGKIFNFESMSPHQIFHGTIHGGEKDLRDLLGVCGHEWPAYVGRSKNSQYGSINFEFIDKEPLPLKNQIVWPKDEYDQLVESISMTLLSDLILYNEFGFPSTDVEDLQMELRRRLGEIRINKAYVGKNEVENFVSVWLLKKPSDTCFSAGSVFLLEIAQDKIDLLSEIQRTGIGERTHEGFGRCAFALQTYSDLIPRYEDEDDSARLARRPSGDIPENVKEIIKMIVKKTIRERLTLEAINQQARFDRLPTNALIARLHSMVKPNDSRGDFVTKLNDLREIAAKQLRQCVSRDCNLFEYLVQFQLTDDTIRGLEETGLDRDLINVIKKVGLNKEFTAFKDMTTAFKNASKVIEELIIPVEAMLRKLEEARDQIFTHTEFRHDPVGLKRFLRQPGNVDLQQLSNEIGFVPEDDHEYVRDLNHSFYATFFMEMRKRKIAEGGGA